MHNLSTPDKILHASILLFSQRGYSGVTTKEIAKLAGVCEMTVFRHFDNKRNLFEKAFEKYVFFPHFKVLFENDLVWDLEIDLGRISAAYQDTLHKNERIILMQFHEDNRDSEAPLQKFPVELRQLLVNYFLTMREKGKVKEDPEVLAAGFLAANFGFFMSHLLTGASTPFSERGDWLSSYIKLLVKAAS